MMDIYVNSPTLMALCSVVVVAAVLGLLAELTRTAFWTWVVTALLLVWTPVGFAIMLLAGAAAFKYWWVLLLIAVVGWPYRPSGAAPDPRVPPAKR